MEWLTQTWEWIQDQANTPVAAWVEAIGTSGAFLIAAVVYAGTVRDKRREQARRVAAWIAPPRIGESRQVYLVNESDQPVFDLRVTPLPGQGEAEPMVPSMLPPGSRDTYFVGQNVGPPEYRLSAPVDLVFVDVANREWHRLGKRHRLRRCRWWHRHPWRHGRRREREQRRRERKRTRETADPG